MKVLRSDSGSTQLLRLAPRSRALRWGAVCALMLMSASPVWADTQTFDKGSLIIPMSASYQTPCGAISAYGLVWRILQANQAGHVNAANPVTVYWAVNLNKTSPNRCVPNNKTAPPSPNVAGPSGATNHWDDPQWNDGCDFQVTNPSHMPSVHVDMSVTPNAATGLWPYGNLTQLNTSSIGVPAYSAQTLSDTGGFNSVQYAGGPYVIDSTDVPAVRALLKNGDPSAGVPVAQLTQFTTSCTCSTVPSTTCHFVEIHQATAPFTITVGKRMNQTPPKIALLDSGAGVKWCPDGGPYGVACGTEAHVLDTYLANAGLGYVDSSGAHQSSGGCPSGSRSNCALNGSVAGPTGVKYPGLIYDQFNSYLDLISTATDKNGLLNRSDAKGAPLYHVFWAPHWDTTTISNNTSAVNFTIGNYMSKTGTDGYPDITAVVTSGPLSGVSYGTYVANGDGALTQRQNAVNNVTYYLNRKSTGMMAECAAIASFEAYNGAVPVPAPPEFMFNLGITANVAPGGFNGRNCTDPNYSSGQCMLWPQPNSLFSQIGDWAFAVDAGTIQSFGNRTTASYKAGISRLALTWNNYKPTYSYTTATDVARDSLNGWDIFTFGMKDNDLDKGTLLYVGGHEYTTSTIGNRLVLNTLLNLGYDPIGSERALTPPISFVDNNYASTDPNYNVLLAGLYKAVQGYPPGSDTYVQSSGSRWYFPYYPGEVRAHQVAAVSGFESQFSDAQLWAANDAMPLPDNRNIFTYLGGRALSSSTVPSLSSVQPTSTVPPNGTLQVGWKPETVSGDTIASASCVDVLQLGKTQEGTYGLIPGADGVCDLLEATEFTTMIAGVDYGAAEWTANRSAMLANASAVQQMLQTVRGNCFATTTGSDGSGLPILHPTQAQCNSVTNDNLATLGGIVSSTMAVVPSSPLADNAAHPRPTVVYVGSYDGQLHALYLSGGAGYTGPKSALTMPINTTDATSTFKTDWVSRFASASNATPSTSGVPAPGTELWAFMPASQLPLLKTNNARITSPPVVMDAFVDITGSGLREWHSILVASTDREVFALDVTNPLKPFLLWDVVGSTFQVASSYPPYSPVTLSDTPTSPNALKWHESTAYFQMPPSTLSAGRTSTGAYDYSDFGGSKGVSIGQARAGLQPVYGAYVTTSYTGLGPDPMGIQVYALELATGQKLWQWEQSYTQAWVRNSTPSTATILRSPDGISRVYVGDMEGRIWELDALSGVNLNNANDPALPSGVCTAPPCNYAAFDTKSTLANPQPVSTNLNVSLMPPSPAVVSPLAKYGGATLMTFGTSGEDWVYLLGAPLGSVAGKFHVLLTDSSFRVPYLSGSGNQLDGTTAWTQSSATTAAKNTGVLQEAYNAAHTFPLTLANGETIYGTVSTSGQLVTFGSAFAPLNNILSLTATGGGNAYVIDLGLGTQTTTALLGGVYGGFSVGNSSLSGAGTAANPVFGLEAGRIVRLTSATAPANATTPTSLSIRGQNGVLYHLKSWLQKILP